MCSRQRRQRRLHRWRRKLYRRPGRVMYVCIYIYDTSMYICLDVYMFIRTYISIYLYIYIYICKHVRNYSYEPIVIKLCMCIYIYICIYTCIYMCVYIHIYVYTHMYMLAPSLMYPRFGLNRVGSCSCPHELVQSPLLNTSIY